MKTSIESVLILVVCSHLGSSANAQSTTIVSLGSSGAQGNGASTSASLSQDASQVAFASSATDLVPGDVNSDVDVFVRNRASGVTSRVSLNSGGTQGNGHSLSPVLSADSRFVAFESVASNLVAGDTNAASDVFVHDRVTGTTIRVSVDSGGAQANSASFDPALSADGRYVAFESFAANLAAIDTNLVADIFVHDRLTGSTQRVSVDSSSAQSNETSLRPSLSADGRYVAFQSMASNLVAGDTNARIDVFVHDRLSGSTSRVSMATGGAQADGFSFAPSISADGARVAFYSSAPNLVPGDTNNFSDVFVHERASGTTTRASVDSAGMEGNGNSSLPSLSSDGRFVAFQSLSTNLVPTDTNASFDVFVHDLLTGVTLRASVDSGSGQGNAASTGAAISADGRFVAFESAATNLVPGDGNGSLDVVLRDGGQDGPVSFCFGDGSGSPCPCNNTGQPGHGCDNSISTGGALLSGGGQALLSADTLVLTASGERPTSFSLFWQGGSEIAPRVFGDGVGCMGAPLKRMFFRNAVGGTATAPQGMDLSVSARSAALGDTITPGAIRVYLVFYRDPDPNFCPPPFGSTFNTTNGLRVLWGS